ncbi:MAG: cytidylate kinase-like family protein [Candidatus Omnitrophica bacterium]|nr:cytidylate kinase-like family protein [Candidatus Omnitrophota bacterium]
MSEYLEPDTQWVKKEKRTAKPFVTISYQVGAYGRSVVSGLSEYFQKYENRKKNTWKVFDNNLVKKTVEDYDLPDSVLPYLAESTSSEIEDMIQSSLGLHPTRFALVYEMNQTILHLAESGYVIIVGRGGNMITRKLSKGFHVRLVGSLDHRVGYLMDYLKITGQEARKFIADEDRRRSGYFKKYFEQDINDPGLYDLMINVNRFSISDVIREIGSLVLKRDS